MARLQQQLPVTFLFLQTCLCFQSNNGARQSGLRTDSHSSHTDHPEDNVVVLAGTDTLDGGASSNGNVLPQLKRPHGMNDWAPQSNLRGDSWWFRRSDKQFIGMRCTHQPSPWIGDYGTFLIQPHLADSPSSLSYDSNTSDFRPYLYRTQLKEKNFLSSPINLEFTATSRAALARVRFSDSSKIGRVSVSTKQGEVEFKDGVLRGSSKVVSHQAPKGWRGMFFVVKPLSALSEGSATGGTGTLKFSPTGPVTLAIATSFISQEQADRNLEQELGKKSFDDVVQENRLAWRSLLGRVKVEALDKERLRVFYTNLWRTMLFPRNLHEIDAQGNAHHFSPYKGDIMPGRLVADSGFWDSYRTVYTLKSIIAPDQLGKLVAGWVTAYDEAKWLPQWASPDQQNSMVGTMGDSVLADAIAKNKWGILTGFDATKAYEAIRKDAFVGRESNYGREGLSDYIQNGYVTSSDSDESVTESQGYWLADAAMSEAAALLGKKEDSEVLAARSKRYTTLFNKDTKFFEPKTKEGHFTQGFDPIAWRNGFTEASAWQYRFDVPQDVAGLNQLFDGNLCGAIGDMMQKTSGTYFHVGGYGSVIHEMQEAAMLQKDFGLYAHSNQPVHHILWIAKRAGCNEIGDKFMRKVASKLYTSRGWSGDEDNGEMASWYVLAALGIFQLEGAKDEMVLGSPSIIQGLVELPQGKMLKIATENQSDDNVHVQKVMWAPSGGTSRELLENTFKYTEMMQGGVLTFTMGKSPKSRSQNTNHDIQAHGATDIL